MWSIHVIIGMLARAAEHFIFIGRQYYFGVKHIFKRN